MFDDQRDWILNPAPDDALAPDGPEAEVDMVEIVGSEMPEPFDVSWCDAPPIWQMVGSSEFSDDDPETVREAGAREVAKALGVGTDWLTLHPNRRTREVYARLRQYFERGAYEDGQSLDVYIGLRPSGGRASLAQEISIFERNTAVRKLAAMEPFRSMKPTMTAKAIKWAYEKHHGSKTIWHGDDTPPRITDEHRAVLMEIRSTGACPSVQTITEHIRAQRMKGREK